MQLDLKIQINTDRERGGNFFRLIHLTKGFAQELERGRRGSRIEGLERREYIRFFSFYFFPHSPISGFSLSLSSLSIQLRIPSRLSRDRNWNRESTKPSLVRQIIT
jgi:hypothetical protein